MRINCILSLQNYDKKPETFAVKRQDLENYTIWKVDMRFRFISRVKHSSAFVIAHL